MEVARAFIVRPFGTQDGIDFDRVENDLIAPALKLAGIEGRCEAPTHSERTTGCWAPRTLARPGATSVTTRGRRMERRRPPSLACRFT